MVERTEPRGIRRWFSALRGYLPHGNTLDEAVFRKRHLLLCWVLGLHVPSLFAFGVWQGYGVEHSAVEVAVPFSCLVFARLARNRRLAAFFVTAGLVYCSAALVHLSGGTIEAHFHFFILIGLIALYQDWVPFLWNVVFTVLSHGVGTTIGADLMFNHSAGQNRPWTWAVIHGVAVLAACVGVIVFWRNTEMEQHRSRTLAGELAAAELAAVQTEADRRQSVSELFVNLARRNQSLLDRQLQLIAELEQHERSPEALGELFKLDHLATRIRRNAESLLVLSGEESPRRWGRPMPLGEVVRAAAAEVEDYRRVKASVNNHLEVEGRVAADLAHLMAELLENATSFSSPGSEVWVRSYVAFDDQASIVVSIEDTGIGMPEETMHAANQVLADPPEVDLRRSQLGLHVVSRLAKRYGLMVRLVPTPGGGTTALVTFPTHLVRESPRVDEPVAASMSAGFSPNGWLGGGYVAPNGGASQSAPAVGPIALAPDPLSEAGTTNVWGDGWHLQAPASPPAPTVFGSAPPSGLVAVPSEPGSPAEPGGDGGSSPETTADGLVRRVPGAQLPGGRRRSPAPESAAEPGDGEAEPGPLTPGPPTTGPLTPGPLAPGSPAPGSMAPGRDPEQTRSKLSRFQAGQRAGRSAAAESPGPAPNEPLPDDEEA